MTMTFYKYQGTGNDFVIVDNRLQSINKKDTKRIAAICDRRFGIGADGFILLENDDNVDFKMVYYNADGNESTMCGNGGRCIVAFAKFLNIIENDTEFVAIDGLHKAKIENGLVHLQMQDVSLIKTFDNHLFLDTGSPHHVQMVSGLDTLNVKSKGSKIRYGAPYNEAGSNVNFVEEISTDNFAVRTYERGVEDETLSCGTGVTAVALAMHKSGRTQENDIGLQTQGGPLNVTFNCNDTGYFNIWLIGPAQQVFKGEIEW
ncbi:diaminopimelate epimerase [Winogradskyella sediminis]|uniref:diaminopimelate epimerase n=1 Tax=Winogradskyella sediminis TaxID=1382466 RepID=UPI000E251D67|nr:diaminopimelate epimerase [Winogradskyella sediminis]